MSEKRANASSGGSGLLTILLLIFLVLKLTETGAVARWSWWWVLSPMWIPVLVVVGIFTTYALVRTAIYFMESIAMSIRSWRERRRKMAEFAE